MRDRSRYFARTAPPVAVVRGTPATNQRSEARGPDPAVIRRIMRPGGYSTRRRRRRALQTIHQSGSVVVRVTMLVRNPFTNDTRVEKEARSLALAGHQVIVVAEGRPSLPRTNDGDGIAVIRVERPLARLPALRFIAYRQRLIRALEVTRPDVLHAHDADALDPVGAAARRLGAPFIYDSHELWLQQGPRGRSAPYWRAFLAYYRLIERRYVPQAVAAISVSPPIVRALAELYQRPFHLVPNYPDATGQVHRREIRSLPGGEGIPDGAPIILRLGGLTAGRGVEELVEAMVAVDEGHLVLLGAGHIGAELGRLAAHRGVADRVHVLAPVPPDQVVDYAASAAIGLSPAIPTSLNDAYSLPNKLFQYMAAGIPVLASDFSHVREIVEGSDAGRTVDMTKPPLIAAALREMLADPEGRRRMGSNARNAVLGRYNWATAERELLAVYDLVASGRSEARALPGSRRG